MGKGIALEFKKRYPAMYEEYADLCNKQVLRPGYPYYYSDLAGGSVINFPTKDHWRSPSKLSYIKDGLDWFRKNYVELGITSIAFPPLGCGNGGLSWDVVGPVMYEKLADLPIEIEIYAPYGTKLEQTTPQYLKEHVVEADRSVTGAASAKINRYWYFILYAIRKLNSDRYSLSVGRTIYQKVCFVLTRAGIQTGFHFVKGTYGPFSKEVKQSVTLLSNANLISEKQQGSMITTIVAPDFVFPARDFTSEDMEKAEHAIDLLSRIKSTDHAEMITTVLFSYDELSRKNKKVKDMEVYQEVLNWKKKYQNAREHEIARTIGNLSALGWMKPVYTGQLRSMDEEMDE